MIFQYRQHCVDTVKDCGISIVAYVRLSKLQPNSSKSLSEAMRIRMGLHQRRNRRGQNHEFPRDMQPLFGQFIGCRMQLPQVFFGVFVHGFAPSVVVNWCCTAAEGSSPPFGWGAVMAKHLACWLDAHLSAAELADYQGARERATTIALAARTLPQLAPDARAELRAAILAAPPFPITGTSRPCPPSHGRETRPSSAVAGGRNPTQEPKHG